MFEKNMQQPLFIAPSLPPFSSLHRKPSKDENRSQLRIVSLFFTIFREKLFNLIKTIE